MNDISHRINNNESLCECWVARSTNKCNMFCWISVCLLHKTVPKSELCRGEKVYWPSIPPDGVPRYFFRLPTADEHFFN